MTQFRCQYCKSALPEGGRICRSCGKIQEAGGVAYGVAEASSDAEAGSAAPKRIASADAGAPKCEVCDGNPVMLKQIEKNPPYIPGVLAFGAFLCLIMAMAWHSLIPTVLCLLLGGGLGYAAFKILTAERRYWLCPKCGDTIDIEPAA
ncbi:MAG: hypothetical protein U0166_02025 [Acidobacteriota bacterium]